MDISYMTLLGSEIKMIIPVALGFIAAKTGILNEKFSRELSRFLLNVLLPFHIFSAVCSVDRTQSSLKEIGTVALISLAAHALAAAVAYLTSFRMKGRDVKGIMRACTIFRNMGFFGIPLLSDVFGAKGAFWAAINVVVFNVLFWTFGVFIYSRAGGSTKFEAKKVLLNPGIITCVIGLAVFFSGLRIYQPVMDAVNVTGDACTPISMILVGGILARLSLRELVCSLPVYHTAVISLAVTPVVSMLVFRAAGLDAEYVAFGTLITALPAASNNAAIAERDGVNPKLAAEIVGVMVVLTLVTVPLVSFLF